MSWHPKPSDYRAVFRGQNPWQSLGHVPKELAPPVRRPLADQLWRVLLEPPLHREQIILGPRRVGKTTVMYQTVGQLITKGVPASRLWWLRLDHPLLLDANLGDLIKSITSITGATLEKPAFLFLDELTYAQNWDLWLKTFFDDRWPVRIVGTSSATAAIRQRGTESGVGRWEEQFLAPYLFTEYLGLRGVPIPSLPTSNLDEAIEILATAFPGPEPFEQLRRQFLLTGGFPELLLQDIADDEPSAVLRSQRVLRSDAVEKAIYKDLPQAFNIQDPVKLERLLYTLAGQIAGIVSPQKLGTSIGLSPPTVEKYVNFLERAFLIFTLPNYSAAEETIQRRGRKVYFADGAVRNAALQRGVAPLADAAELGILLENMAAAHLHALSQQTGVRLFHWRHQTEEVDLIYDHPDRPLAFEVALSGGHPTRGLRALQDRFPRFRGRCYIVCAETAEITLPNEEQPGYLPIDAFLMAVGDQTDRALSARLNYAAPAS